MSSSRSSTSSRLFLGLISGTSMDGIDAALVEIGPTRPRLRAARTVEYPPGLVEELRDLKDGRLATSTFLSTLSRLDVQIGEAFARAALTILEETGTRTDEVRAIGSHGQTIHHAPHDAPPHTLQIGDPGLIAVRTGIPTVGDFRRQDVALGGEGAPLVPLFHHVVFSSPEECRVVLNLGGIANVTILPAGGGESDVRGFDTGPGNTLLDAWARKVGDEDCDRDARLSRCGHCDEALLRTLLADPYFRRAPPKSTGPEYFSLSWLESRLGATPTRRAADVARTLVELTAQSVSEAIASSLETGGRVLMAGGGVHHPLLVEALERLCAPHPVVTTASLGIDPDFVEAMAFAWLAWRRLEGLAGNLPAVTGAQRAVPLGGLYLPASRRSGRGRSGREG